MVPSFAFTNTFEGEGEAASWRDTSSCSGPEFTGNEPRRQAWDYRWVQHPEHRIYAALESQRGTDVECWRMR